MPQDANMIARVLNPCLELWTKSTLLLRQTLGTIKELVPYRVTPNSHLSLTIHFPVWPTFEDTNITNRFRIHIQYENLEHMLVVRCLLVLGYLVPQRSATQRFGGTVDLSDNCTIG